MGLHVFSDFSCVRFTLVFFEYPGSYRTSLIHGAVTLFTMPTIVFGLLRDGIRKPDNMPAHLVGAIRVVAFHGILAPVCSILGMYEVRLHRP